MATMWWIRRDFRVLDNEALQAARSNNGETTAVFCKDPRFGTGTARAGGLNEALRRLESEIGDVVRLQGDPVKEIVAAAVAAGVREVHATGDSGPYGRMRDRQVGDELRERGIEFVVSGSNYIVAPGTILNAKGGPMKTFNGFKKVWLRTIGNSLVKYHPLSKEGQAPAPVSRLEDWIERVGAYPLGRDYPAQGATSGLSVDLRFGSIHPGRVAVTASGRSGAERLIEQLCWREWYADNLWHDPASAWRNGSASARRPECDTGEMAQRRFEAWCRGTTGYPLVDAGMRQLAQTGWMHNRVRMVCASFLVKDLHLPWQWGARFFLDNLRDGDLASNNLSWQWIAGTGVDASPYYRIFNPTAQAERFDPEGAYIRTWIPELGGVAGREVHQPGAGGYLTAIIDHATEREEALKRHKVAQRG